MSDKLKGLGDNPLLDLILKNASRKKKKPLMSSDDKQRLQDVLDELRAQIDKTMKQKEEEKPVEPEPKPRRRLGFRWKR